MLKIGYILYENIILHHAHVSVLLYDFSLC